MSIVDSLLEESRETHTINGHDFVCLRWNASLALEALGANAFAIVSDGQGGSTTELKPEVLRDRNEFARKILQVAMLSPRLGDRDDSEQDTVTMRTLLAVPAGDGAGSAGMALFNMILGSDAAQAANFPESSEGQEA